MDCEKLCLAVCCTLLTFVGRGVQAFPEVPSDSRAAPAVLLVVDDAVLQKGHFGAFASLLAVLEDVLVRTGGSVGVVSTGPSAIALDLTTDWSSLRAIAAAAEAGKFIPDSADAHTALRIRDDTLFAAASSVDRLDVTKKVLIVVSRSTNVDAAREPELKRVAERLRSPDTTVLWFDLSDAGCNGLGASTDVGLIAGRLRCAALSDAPNVHRLLQEIDTGPPVRN